MSQIILSTTARLTLRALEVADAGVLYQYRNQPDVALFQGWTPTSAQEVADYACSMQQRAFAQPEHWYQVVLQLNEDYESSSAVIGDVAFCINASSTQAELGIAIDEKYHHQGFAQEAVNALVDYLFADFNLHRIHVAIDPANAASRQLFKRVGFRQEGHLIQSVYFKGQWCDDIIMAILKTERQKTII